MGRPIVVLMIVACGLGLVFTESASAAFTGRELFLPSVGRGPGAAGSQWTTTMWIHNPGTDPANVQIMLLLRGQANPTPDVFYETVQPGETVRYEDAIGALFGGSAFGALRIISDERVVVASRIYSRQPGQTEGDSVGQFFAAVPAGFSVGAGQQTSLLGVFQTTPAETSDYRYNFGFVETTGQLVAVEVIAFGGDGTVLGAREYSLVGYEPKQVNITDLVPGLDTTNARIEVIVVGGTGRIIAFGSGLANASSDPSTFEMTFDDQLLGGGGGVAVVTDPTLTGDGTPGAPLGIADGGVGNTQLGADSVGSGKIVDGTIGPLDLAPGAVRKANIAASGGASGDALTWDGSNLTWKSPITLPMSFSGTSSATAQEPYDPLFLVSDNGDGAAIFGSTINGVGIYGASGYGEAGVVGYGAYLASGVKGSGQRAGVEGTNIANSNWAMLGTPYYAVDARAESGSGVRAISTTDHGVMGRSEASDSAGIYGINEDGGYAGYFHGNVEITGSLAKGGGAFKIDHPLDPANRYLQHSFVESPDMMNVYNGNVELDEDGEAWVELPDWFEVLNRDFRYQLTCLGSFAPVFVAEKVAGNRFRIAGGDPGLEVSWQITGIRHDPWADANRIEVEPEKPETERDFYLHPSLYGQPADRDVTRVNR